MTDDKPKRPALNQLPATFVNHFAVGVDGPYSRLVGFDLYENQAVPRVSLAIPTPVLKEIAEVILRTIAENEAEMAEQAKKGTLQ